MNVLNVVEFLALLVGAVVLVVKVTGHFRRHWSEVSAMEQAAREYHPSRWNG